MKSIIAAGLLLGMHTVLLLLVPTQTSKPTLVSTGSDYTGSATDVHVGYEGNGWYVQGGPALLAPDGGEGDIELSGKAGGSCA